MPVLGADDDEELIDKKIFSDRPCRKRHRGGTYNGEFDRALMQEVIDQMPRVAGLHVESDARISA